MFSADLGGVTASSAPSSNDPPFQKVALLLHGDGTNGAQNNTFVDYSYPGGYAVSFDGTGDYLSVDNNASLDLSSGNFTIEAWVYWTGVNSSATFVQKDGVNVASYPSYSLDVNGANKVRFIVGSGNGTSSVQSLTSSVTLPTNTWVHLAAVKNGTNLSVYQNGINVASATQTATIINGNKPVLIGYQTSQPSSTYMSGSISNLRIVKGTALYTSNFTPSNLPLTAVSGTQLLTCQSATIVDNSPNAFTITANGDAAAVASKTITRTGNVAQGTFSPFSLAEGQWSNYFDGSGDYLIKTGTDTLSGNFTIEYWMYPTATGNYPTIFCNFSGSTASISAAIYAQFVASGSSSFIFQCGNGSTDGNIGTYTAKLNTWTHHAIVRSGSTITAYVNGVSIGSRTSSVAFPLSSLGIGSYSGSYAGSYPFFGYISNFRIVNGTAVYTANFTPPTSSLTAISGTSLLTCQSNRFKDNSSNNFTITRNGDTKVTAFSPFAPSAAYDASTNGGSGYFDGSGDSLTLSGGVTNAGTGDFCLELWTYFTGSYGTYTTIWDSRTTGGGYTDGISLNLDASGNWVLGFTVLDLNTSVKIAQNQWQHVCATRQSGVIRLFVNGVLGGTLSSSNNLTSTTNRIGQNWNNTYYYTGYMSNLRAVKTSVPTEYQTSSTTVGATIFTPPTAPLTAVTNTQLLLNCTNAGIVDNSGKNDIETVGNAQISTSVKKYGTGSMYFDGTGDYLAMPASTELNITSGNFTIEAWVLPGSQTNSVDSVFGYGYWTTMLYRNGLTWTWEVGNGSGSNYFTLSATCTQNVWQHIALTRSGNTYTFWLNGVAASTTTNSNGPATASRVLAIGLNAYNASPTSTQFFTGYIDDLRITKGQALYTSNFTPPAQSLPNV